MILKNKVMLFIVKRILFYYEYNSIVELNVLSTPKVAVSSVFLKRYHLH
jgi:hypothetical protein